MGKVIFPQIVFSMMPCGFGSPGSLPAPKITRSSKVAVSAKDAGMEAELGCPLRKIAEKMHATGWTKRPPEPHHARNSLVRQRSGLELMPPALEGPRKASRQGR